MQGGIGEFAPDSLSSGKLRNEEDLSGSSAVDLFDRVARESLDSIAVEAAGRALSYGELAEGSNRLAARLRSLGARPDAFVAVCLDRTVDFAAAVIGVARSGAAWVPLDPSHPRERLNRILEIVKPVAIVTDEVAQGILLETGTPRVWLRGGAPTVAGRAIPAPAAPSPGHAAYVMFTSGSTGEPKGAVLTHEGLSNYVREMGSTLRITPSDAYLHTASIGFSSSVRQLLVPLTHGARVVMAAAGQIRDPAVLFLEAIRRGVSIVDFVPSYWRALMDALGRLDPASRNLVRGHRLRLALSASEPLPADLVRRWRSEFGRSEQFVNMYGQTETTGIVALHSIPHDLPDTAASLPIGQPIGGVRIEILDDELRPVPRGALGEIWIAGAGVGRGYLGRDEETSAAFRADPRSAGPEARARIYRTGDLGRERPDGAIEHHGRRDDQVKIRGVRVELDEVSRTLSRVPGVCECAVLAHEGEPGVHQLIAYVVPHSGASQDVAALRSQLATWLPDAMVPSAFRFLEALPRTASGKIDRVSLLASEASGSRGHTDDDPRTPRERALAEIWAEVLGVDGVGRNDDFFELGGDSISAFRMLARAHARGIRISSEQLLAHPTVAGLGAAVEEKTERGRPDPEEQDGPLAPTPIACWFQERRLPAPDHYSQAVVLETRPDADPAKIQLSLEALLLHHDALRTRWIEAEGEIRARIAAPGEGAGDWFERRTVDSLGGEPREAASLLQGLDPTAPGANGSVVEVAGARAQASLNLSGGPILRALHFQVRGGPGRLLLCIHHVAVDGVSWRILLEDLHTAYEQLSSGSPVSLPAGTTSIRRAAARIAAQASSAEVRAQAPFWEELAKANFSRLPRDGPSPDANTVASTRTVSASLTREETRALLRDCTAAYRCEIDELLLAALARGLAAWTGDSSIFVDIEGHGREALGDDVDVSRTVGWFTIIWPLLLRISAVGDGRESIRQVQEQYRRARDRRRSFFLLRYLGDAETRATLSRIPQPEVRFNNLGRFDGVIAERSAFRLTRESPGPSSAPGGDRRSLIDIFGSVLDGILRFDWGYSSNVHRVETVESALHRFMDELRALIGAAETLGGSTPEFPLAGLDEAALDRALARVQKGSLR